MHRVRHAVAALNCTDGLLLNSPFRRFISRHAVKASAVASASLDENASHPDAAPPVNKPSRNRKPQSETPSTDLESNAPAPLKKRRGRPPKSQLPADAPLPSPADTAAEPATTPKKPSRRSKQADLIDTITPGSTHHNNLTTFLAHASRTRLDVKSNVYLGTHYEYTVAASLTRLHFNLTRVGRTADLGIDLLGTWVLPSLLHPLSVLVQCKAEAPRPSMVRELEGAVVGAPARFRGEGTVALLAAAKEATKGVRDAVSRSAMPMGFVNVTSEGVVRQFVWNHAAVAIGLDGVGVALRYSVNKEHEIALTWNRLPWPAS